MLKKKYHCKAILGWKMHADHWETHNYRNVVHGALATILNRATQEEKWP